MHLHQYEDRWGGWWCFWRRSFVLVGREHEIRWTRMSSVSQSGGRETKEEQTKQTVHFRCHQLSGSHFKSDFIHLKATGKICTNFTCVTPVQCNCICFCFCFSDFKTLAFESEVFPEDIFLARCCFNIPAEHAQSGYMEPLCYLYRVSPS